MKNIRKVVFSILILTVLITPFFAFLNVEAEEASEPQRGDLRCPLQKEANVKCTEHKTNGIVTSVDLVYTYTTKEGGTIEIIKTVTKDLSNLGHYYVQFKVNGKNVSQKKTIGKVYIAFILDYSKTIEGQLNAGTVQKAAKNFAKQLIPDSDNGNADYYIKLLAFSNKVGNLNKGFTNYNFNNVSFPGFGRYGASCEKGRSGSCNQSFIDRAFDNVQFPKGDEKKYIFIYGDGRYWYDKDTNVGAAINKANNFKNQGVKIYGIRYNGSCIGDYLADDTASMKKLVTYYYDARNIESQFKDIADLIKKDVEESSSSYTTDLTDRLGDAFYLTNDVGDYQRFNVGKLREGWTSPKFEIEIDQYVKGNDKNGGGWHETNENFNLTYTDEAGESHTLKVDYNPEVYWIPYDLNLHSCHGVSVAGTVREDESDEYQFFTKSCKEGYMENGAYKSGFTTEVMVNELDKGVRQFDILSGLGFPTHIKMSTNVVCRYKFNYDEFNRRYQQQKRGYDRASKTIDTSKDAEEVEAAKKDMASAQKEMTKLDKILLDYSGYSKQDDLNAYVDRFKKQNATMTITYKNSKSAPDNVTFENLDNTVKTSVNCQVKSRQTVNGINLVKDQTCYVSLSKEMHLAASCLNMKTGDQEACIENSNKQILGGDKFYTKMKETGGYITLKVPKAGYKQNLDIELKQYATDGKAECEFSSESKLTDIMYRQIELDDPFLKNYDKSRGVGKNYANERYNFEKIIKPDTWSQNADYSYALSKSNIVSIRKDTAEEGVTSYTGRNCYFNSSNKYVCDFTRNRDQAGDGSSSNWFTNSYAK